MTNYPVTYTEASVQALRALRSAENFNWAIVPIFAFTVYVYFAEIEKKNWNVVLAALGAYALEWLAEIANALILHFSERSALWTTPGKSSFIILVGINVEITMMFAVAGLIFAKILPKDRDAKILGLPSRWALVVGYAFLGVSVESILNRWNALIWEYRFWNWPHVWSIALFAYGPFMWFCFWIYDLKTMRAKVTVVSSLIALNVICFVLFVGILKWI